MDAAIVVYGLIDGRKEHHCHGRVFFIIIIRIYLCFSVCFLFSEQLLHRLRLFDVLDSRLHFSKGWIALMELPTGTISMETMCDP